MPDARGFKASAFSLQAGVVEMEMETRRDYELERGGGLVASRDDVPKYPPPASAREGDEHASSFGCSYVNERAAKWD